MQPWLKLTDIFAFAAALGGDNWWGRLGEAGSHSTLQTPTLSKDLNSVVNLGQQVQTQRLSKERDCPS